MRKTVLNGVFELAKRDPRVCFIGSDLGFGVLDDFRAAFPDRFFREGVSEQHIIGMAAGMALDGKIVYVNTIASFLTKRCFEQIHLDLCLTGAKVRLIGSGGGLVYAPLGPTHLSAEDIGILRPLPGMTILAPRDAVEMAALLPQTLDIDGPVYIRLAKGGDKVMGEAEPPVVGRATRLRQGRDALFVTTGIGAQIALEAAALLAERGIEAGALHCHTVKPLDEAAILEEASRVRAVVCVEEHVRTGGLGSAVAELLAEARFASPPAFRRAALPDVFFSEHGSQAAIMARYGLDAAGLVRLVMSLDF